MRTQKINPLSKFPVYNMLLTIVTLLYIKSEHSSCITDLCTLWPTLLHFSLSPAPGNDCFTLCVYEPGCFRFHMSFMQYFSFCAWFISLSIIICQCHPHCHKWQDYLLYLEWTTFHCINLYTFIYVTFSLSFIHQWTLRLCIWAIVNYAAMSTRVQISLQDTDFISYE